MTYDEFVALALSLPETVEESDRRGTSVVRESRWMFSLKSLKKEGETVVLKLGWDDHDRLIEAHPDVLFKTPHYEGYPAFLVRLEALSPELARELVGVSWNDAPLPAKKRRAE